MPQIDLTPFESDLSPRQNKFFGRAIKRAATVLADRVRVLRVTRRAYEKLIKDEGGMDRVRDDVRVLVRLLRAWARKEYKGIPWRSLLYAMGGLIYFLSPLDLIPDFIPIIGYTDDVAVMIAVVRAIRKDLGRFTTWESKRSPRTD